MSVGGGSQRPAAVAILICGLLLARPAAGQETQAAANKDQGPQVETVVVTAERRTQDLQKTAIAASVLTGEDLKHKGINTLDQLQFTTPSLSVQNFGTGDFINLRGIGQSLFSIQVSSGVVIYFDDIPVAISGFLADEPYYDMASVQVLRGPQGTFAGLSSTGGAIFERSADPSFDETNGYFEGQYGNFKDVRVRGMANLVLDDDAAMRFAFSAEDRDSFFHISGPWTGNPGKLHEGNARWGFHWQPIKPLDIVFKINYNYIDNGGYPSVPATTPTDRVFDPSFDTHLMGLEHWGRASLKIAYTFEDGIKVQSITGYALARNAFDLDLDGTAVPKAQLIFNDIAWGWGATEEFDILSRDTGPLTWVAGGLYFKQLIAVPPPPPGKLGATPGNNGFDYDIISLANLENPDPLGPGSVEGLGLVYSEPKSSYASYGQVGYKILSDLKLTVGARFTKSFTRLDDTATLFERLNTGPLPLPVPIPPLPIVLPAQLPSLPLPPGVPTTPPPSVSLLPVNGGQTLIYLPSQSVVAEHESDSKIIGKANLDWNVDEDNFLFALVATGYKPGGINLTAPLPWILFAPPPPNGTNQTSTTPAPKFRPESVIDYEVGWKSTLFDGHIRTQVGGFYENYKGFQVAVFNPQSKQADTDNVAGITKVDGIEAQLQGAFDALSFDLGGAYTHTKLGTMFAPDSRTPALFTNVNGPCDPATGPATPANPNTVPQQAACVNDTGKPLPYAPVWTANISAQYVVHLFDKATLTPRFSYGMTGPQKTTLTQLPSDRIGAHNLINGQLEFDDDPWSVTLYGTNLADLHYIAASGIYAPGLANPGPPRQFGIRLFRIFN